MGNIAAGAFQQYGAQKEERAAAKAKELAEKKAQASQPNSPASDRERRKKERAERDRAIRDRMKGPKRNDDSKRK